MVVSRGPHSTNIAEIRSADPTSEKNADLDPDQMFSNIFLKNKKSLVLNTLEISLKCVSSLFCIMIGQFYYIILKNKTGLKS